MLQAQRATPSTDISDEFISAAPPNMLIIERIQAHLASYREKNGLRMEYITETDLDSYKGASGKCVAETYKKPWNKLSIEQKINRLDQYHAHLSRTYNLSPSQQEGLKTLFRDITQRNLLDEKDMIHYDGTDGSIMNINGLKQTSVGDWFLQNMVIRRPETVTNVAPVKMKPLSMETLQLINTPMAAASTPQTTMTGTTSTPSTISTTMAAAKPVKLAISKKTPATPATSKDTTDTMVATTAKPVKIQIKPKIVAP